MTKEKQIPMRLQPNNGGRNMPTQMQPAMPSFNLGQKTPADLAVRKAQPDATMDSVRAAKAREMRLASLRKQRDATRP